MTTSEVREDFGTTQFEPVRDLEYRGDYADIHIAEHVSKRRNPKWSLQHARPRHWRRKSICNLILSVSLASIRKSHSTRKRLGMEDNALSLDPSHIGEASHH